MVLIHRWSRHLAGISLLLIGALIFSPLPAKAELILDVSHSPEVPLPGEMVNVTVRVADPSNVSFVQIFWCNFDSGSCYPSDMYYGGNDTYWRGIGGEENIINGTVIGYNVTVENTTGHRDYYPEATKYVNITYVGPSPPAKPAPPLITLELVLVEALLIGITVALLGILAWRKMNGLETSKVAAMGIVILIILAIVYGAVTILTRPTEVEIAKDFQAIDTDGHMFNLSDFRGEVVILDFMSISCGGCEIIAGTIMDDVHAHFDESELEVISIDVSVADDIDSLRAFKEDKAYPWRMAMDPGGLVNDYAVSSLPTLVVIDKEGYAVKVVADAYTSASSMRGMIDDALAGRSQAIGITETPIILRAA